MPPAGADHGLGWADGVQRADRRDGEAVLAVCLVATGAANFSISANGTLVYAPGTGSGSVERSLVWVDREGGEEPIDVPRRAYTYARLSDRRWPTIG